jgi:hypothetical protein
MKALANVWKLATATMILAAALVAAPAAAQTVTTGSISGTVEDPQGGRLPGAVVQAVHTPTGTSYESVTDSEGRFSVLNVRVGPYVLRVAMPGFKKFEQKDVVVSLGEDRGVTIKLELERVAETVTVTAENPPIDLTRAGTAGNIENRVKEVLPTISRSLTDLARTNIYFNPTANNDETPTPSVGGRSQRYNNLQIDGAVNNDLFGLAAGGGVPGGSAGTQPISLDAIQEIQLVVSPYDIRQSGFSGGGINAITKSGTNERHGTAFLFGRNQSWVGKGCPTSLPCAEDLRKPISTFKDIQGGFSLGDKLIENRAFYFTTVDIGRRKQPSGFSINGTGVQFAQDETTLAAVDRFLSILKNTYNYDLGPTAKDEYIREQNSDKIFVRTDFNIARSQLTVRHNFVNARSDNGFPSATTYIFPDGFNRFKSRTNSTVGQLTSRFGSAVNELRVALTTVRESRNPQPGFPAEFPFVSVTLFGSTLARAGLDGPSQANQLDQDIVEVTNDYTRVWGRHQLTVGTHNEFFKFRNLFINGFKGTYTFNSLDLFEQGLAQSFTHSFSATDDPLQAAKFRVNHMGIYAGDQWRVLPRLTLTYGIRADFVRYPTAPNANPVAETNFGFRTDVVPNNTLYSPRAGFNYALRADGMEQVRGGVGLFTGRTPYVWISNQYGNTGVDFIRLNVSSSAANRIPFVADPNNQPTSLPNVVAATNEIDVIDPEFKYPSIIRGNLAYDRKLPFGLYGTVELLMTSVVQDIRYENLNLQQIRTSNLDGRPVFARNKVPTLGDVLLLTNAGEGSAWTIAVDVKRPFSNGLFVNGAYLYGQAKSIADGVRDQAASQWGNIYTTGDPNHPTLGISDYDPGHQVKLTATYDFKVWRGYRATASLFYTGQSGRPYTLLWGSGQSTGSVNGDTQNNNDILFLPNAEQAANFVFTNGTYDDLRRYLDSKECTAKQVGGFMERNSCRSPWSTTLDARFAVTLPIQKVNAEITLDILNLANLIDNDKGIFRYALFNDIIPVSATATGGVVTGMNLATLNSPSFSEFTKTDLRSRWQMQLGARLRF